MPSNDPHTGGSITDMATSGTSIPNDAGKQRIIPSVPNPHQNAAAQDPVSTSTDLGGAVDNPTDIPRQSKDIGPTGEVMTGVGDTMPVQAESKRMHLGANEPLSKGHDRYDKHSRQKESDYERYAAGDTSVDMAPGEEGTSQEELKQRREG
ncbi:MAG: hypothetical protein M4579_003935 [Chaenotheca gracillima]|nr:MAG: hypothetical protein M4579_003935 [Chaenotheca gracillima]